MPSNFDMEKAKKNIKLIREKMRSNTDSFLLNDYHKLFRKEISFFKRSWAAAWLFMYYDQKEIPAIGSIEKKLPEKGKKNKIAVEKTLADAELSEKESKKLFISIGKNRRLFPKEVISLIMSRTTAAREDIGTVKILDNYSFVQVSEKKADEIINALNGVKFRGRNIAVNYAKSKGGA